MERFWQPGRIWRLCLKELRETLRDRRTVTTLLLMPILVYPLLSVALNRLLFSARVSTGPRVFYVGVTTEKDRVAFEEAIQLGQAIQKQRPAQSILVERRDPKWLRDLKSEPDPKPEEPAVFRISMAPLSLESVVVAEDVDIGIVAESESAGPAENAQELRYRFRVLYRQDDGKSESALREFQNILQLVNDIQSRALMEKMHVSFPPATKLMAEPVRGSSTAGSGLTTIIPLVLLLMTITGAVYPAIDLTAGERERGTMEALIASPVPRYELLLSKYVAVVTVAMLTAIANVGAMWITMQASGMGKVLFGDSGFSLFAVMQILPLLLVFACFFSAILLALCSFARSFKEAQAYLIPVMLFSLAPGVLSLMPGIEFTPTLAIVPLVNVILLSRDILTGTAPFLPATAAILSTIVYAAAALGLAARLFGMDATSHGAEGSWGDLIRRPTLRRDLPRLDHMAFYLAALYPVYFVLTNVLGRFETISLSTRLWLNFIVTTALFLVGPLLFSLYRRMRTTTTFKLRIDRVYLIVALLGAVLLSTALWMGAHELFLLSEWFGWKTLNAEQMEAAKSTKDQLQQLPLVVILITMALGPAVAEEFFFRGFVLSSMHRLSAIRAIVFSSLLFGLFHVMTGSVMSLERFLPTTFLGLVLGFVAWRTQSLFPSIVLHTLHNGLLFTAAYHDKWLMERGWGMVEGKQLPTTWIAYGITATLIGLVLVWFSRRRIAESPQA